LRTTAAPWIATGLQIRKTGETYKLASTQGYQSMDTPDGGHRPLVARRCLRNIAGSPTSPPSKSPTRTRPQLYKPYPYKEEEYAWAWRST